jgi:hypothetical protein
MKVQYLPEWGEIEGYIDSKKQGIEIVAEKTGIKIKFAERIKGGRFVSPFAEIDIKSNCVGFTRYGLAEVMEILDENFRINEGENNES